MPTYLLIYTVYTAVMVFSINNKQIWLLKTAIVVRCYTLVEKAKIIGKAPNLALNLAPLKDAATGSLKTYTHTLIFPY